ncbi:MAG: FlgD immunoglobulin-like domain containing protein, partial [bacterium]
VEQPSDFVLFQNYPNPFNTTTTIRYAIPSREQRAGSEEQRGRNIGLYALRTTLKIYNLLGQEVQTLVDETKEPGYYTVTWHGEDGLGREVVSGVYIYELKVVLSRRTPPDRELGFGKGEHWKETKKMVLLR